MSRLGCGFSSSGGEFDASRFECSVIGICCRGSIGCFSFCNDFGAHIVVHLTWVKGIYCVFLGSNELVTLQEFSGTADVVGYGCALYLWTRML